MMRVESQRGDAAGSPALYAALLGVLVCAVMFVFTTGVIGANAAAPLAQLRDAVIAGWLAQLACLAVVVPGCVTLWRVAGALRAAVVFILIPVPLWVLAVAATAVPPSAAVRAIGALLVCSAVSSILGGLAALMRPAAAGAAAVLAPALALGIVVTIAGRGLAWTGL